MKMKAQSTASNSYQRDEQKMGVKSATKGHFCRTKFESVSFLHAESQLMQFMLGFKRNSVLMEGVISMYNRVSLKKSVQRKVVWACTVAVVSFM